MSGRIDELERLLDLADCDGECHRCDHGTCEAIGNLPGFTDTLRALVDVAKAAEAMDADWNSANWPTAECYDALHAALAPLFHDEGSDVVQDAQQCPTCNGHGGGGGFDRNGSHTEERYCEYPCPECGKEATDE